MWKEIRNTFLTGLLIMIPMALTMILIIWLFNSIDRIFREPIENLLGFRIYGLGLFLTLLIILIVGMAARNYFGIKLITFTELLLGRIPLVRTLYFSIKQLTETIYGNKQTAFRKAVLVEYPSKGIYAIGFITSSGTDEVEHRLGKKVVSIFIPTTPNPTSGMLVMMAKDDLIELDISVEDAIKLVVSGGIVKPNHKNKLSNPIIEERKE